MAIRAWASGLDRGTYEAQATEDGLYIQSTPPEEVVRAMEPRHADIRRAQESTRLLHRYYVLPRQNKAEPISAEDLVADLAVAQELLANPAELNTAYQWDAPAAVAAAALEANLIRDVDLSHDALRFAAETVLRIGAGETPTAEFESEVSFFEQGADRNAARVLPLLLLPAAVTLRALLEPKDPSRADERVTAAVAQLAGSVANEVRVHLARGLDAVWEVPCTRTGTCHHQMGLHSAIDTMRDCAFGDWDHGRSRRGTVHLQNPVGQQLAGVADEAVYFSRLDAAIRALAPAATAHICVSAAARDLLEVLLAAHRRALLAHERNMDDRGTHALVAAHALLTLAADGEDTPIFDHIDAYADSARAQRIRR